MSGTLTRPDWQTAIAGLARRIGILERRVTPRSPPDPTNDDIIFSYAGGLATGESPPAILRYSGVLAALAVAFGTSGSSTTTIEVEQNGTVVATVTIGSGVVTQVTEIGVRVATNDLVTLVIGAAGTGASDMTAAARFT